jgi:hypothetical protein
LLLLQSKGSILLLKKMLPSFVSLGEKQYHLQYSMTLAAAAAAAAAAAILGLKKELLFSFAYHQSRSNIADPHEGCTVTLEKMR